MTATIQKPEDKICSNCADARKEAGIEPMVLVELSRRTERKRLAIRVCPNCDGDVDKIALKNS